MKGHFTIMHSLYERKSQVGSSLSLTRNTCHVPFVNNRKEAAGSETSPSRNIWWEFQAHLIHNLGCSQPGDEWVARSSPGAGMAVDFSRNRGHWLSFHGSSSAPACLPSQHLWARASCERSHRALTGSRSIEAVGVCCCFLKKRGYKDL